MARFYRSGVRRVELLLWIFGALCAGYLGFVSIEARVARAASYSIVQDEAVPEQRPPMAAVMGWLEIPALSLSVPVMSDFEPNSLLRGVGHIQGTAMPGGLGTMGLAGHRDTYFRPLRRIALGMRIDVTDGSGTYHYEVDSTEIVTPEQVRVLDIQDRPSMTLVTCYPFDYVGAAPKRFIVYAHLLSASADAVR